MSFFYVFVLNGDNQPLSPCHPAVARKLLRQDKATLVRIIPFTIRLRQSKESPSLQPCSCSLDDGAKTAGLALLQHNQSSDRVLFKAELALRNNVKQLLSNRRMRRHARRSRLRHRQPRQRRKDRSGRPPESIRVRKENILRVVQELALLCPISRIVYEEGQFDLRGLTQQARPLDSPNKDATAGNWENRKQAVLWRDRYVCQYCQRNCIEQGLVAQVDHIIPRSRGGTTAWSNLVCACQKCNQDKGSQTATEYGYPQMEGKVWTYPAWLQTGKTYLKEALSKIAVLLVRYGWQTANDRKRLGLCKSHTNDAIALAAEKVELIDPIGSYQMVARRGRSDMYNLRHSEGYGGLKHYDLVCWHRKDGRTELGTVRSFVPARKIVKCRFTHNSNQGVAASRLQLVQRSRSIVFLPDSLKGRDGSSTAEHNLTPTN